MLLNNSIDVIQQQYWCYLIIVLTLFKVLFDSGIDVIQQSTDVTQQ